MAELIPCDLHIHPDYSIDSDTSIEKYCIRAQELNIPAIGFTTHYDTNPIFADTDGFMDVDGERVPVDDYSIGRYVDDCHEARIRFPELKILIGMEVDYFTGVEAEIYRLRKEFDFDFMIGSVHILDGINIASRTGSAKYFSAKPVDKMADQYFNLMYNVANSGLFELIGHADYYLRFGPLYYGQEIFNVYRGRVDRVIEAALKTKTGFEINTSYRRHGGDSFFPQPDFLVYANKRDAKFLSIGSDSHTLNHLGENIAETLKKVYNLGITLEPFYESRET